MLPSLPQPDLTGHWVGFATLAMFAVAYVLVIAEEVIRLRKSKPVVVAAGDRHRMSEEAKLELRLMWAARIYPSAADSMLRRFISKRAKATRLISARASGFSAIN